VVVRCGNCGTEGGIEMPLFECGKCGSGDLEVIGGKELYLDLLEVNDDERNEH
ncbi:MAG: hydrogenase maturation nickel metallochaperone HypA, partial [Lentisphaerae bacterium]|nr:hydrogenase maturation nickel metallochaperone HypA [Lentisphaerota bacterium]